MFQKVNAQSQALQKSYKKLQDANNAQTQADQAKQMDQGKDSAKELM